MAGFIGGKVGGVAWEGDGKGATATCSSPCVREVTARSECWAVGRFGQKEKEGEKRDRAAAFSYFFSFLLPFSFSKGFFRKGEYKKIK